MDKGRESGIRKGLYLFSWVNEKLESDYIRNELGCYYSVDMNIILRWLTIIIFDF